MSKYFGGFLALAGTVVCGIASTQPEEYGQQAGLYVLGGLMLLSSAACLIPDETTKQCWAMFCGKSPEADALLGVKVDTFKPA